MFLKKYELTKEVLGIGEFGQVFKAKRKKTKKDWKESDDKIENTEYVAVKVITKSKIKSKNDVDDERAIRAEIRILNTLDHPNIVKYYEEYENDKYMYLVMEYCEGGDMYDIIAQLQKENKGFSEKEAAKIMETLLRAINHCHENKICHRDLKPENIMIGSEGLIKIIDFGLSIKR